MKLIKSFLFLISFFTVYAFNAQISVKGNIDHVVPNNIDSLGNLILDVSGGVSPYLFKWMPDNTTVKDRTNANRNFYSLRVKDNNGDSVFYNYNLGYKTRWSNFNGMGFTNDSLILATSVPSLQGYPSIRSVNILRANTQGWAEMVLGPFVGESLTGFLDSASVVTPGDIYDIDYSFHITYGNAIYAYSPLVNFVFLGYGNVGDVITMGRNDTTFYIKVNNITKHSQSITTNKNLQLKTIMLGGVLVNIGTSFADSTMVSPLQVNASVDHIKLDGVDTLGNIKLNISGGSTPYTYKWTPDNTTIKNKTNTIMNAYSVKVKSFLGDSVIYNYNLGYKTAWSNFNGMGFSNDSLLLATSVPTLQGYPSARSVNKLGANSQGWTEMVLRPYGDQSLIGFLDSASVDSPGDINDIDYSFHITYGNALYAYSPKVNFVFLGYGNVGDVITMGRDATSFYIKINGFTKHSQAISTSKALKLKAIVLGDVLVNIGCSFNSSLKATVVKEHADYDNLKNGSAYIVPENGLGPYQVSWEDGLIAHSRNDLAPGNYKVTITDSLFERNGIEIKIGVKPNWNIKQNINYTADSIMKIESNQKGVLVSHNISYNEQDAWFENKILNKNTDLVFGFIGVDKSNIDSNYTPPVFPAVALEQKLILVNQLYDKAIRDSLSYSNGALNIGGSSDNLFFVRIHNGTILSLLQGASNNQYNFNDGDVLKIGRNSIGNIYFAVNDEVIFSNSANISSQYLVSSILLNSNTGKIAQTGIFTNSLQENLSFQANPNPFCANDACRTWVTSKTFDENGNVINQGKQYYDQFGRPTQSQQKSFSINNVLASESFYDAFGRPTGNTLVAPTWQTNLCFKSDFFAHPNGIGHYSVIDFDKAVNNNGLGEINNPNVVGFQNKGQLGWYYSNNNNEEYSVPADFFPYSRVEYSNDPLGRIIRQSGVGENHKMGTGHEMTTFYGNSALELNQVFPLFSNELKEDFTLKKYNSTDYNVNLKTIHKTTTRNQDGKLSFTFTDNLGKVAATCVEGGDDVLCNNGYGINQLLLQNNVGYLHVFVPKDMIPSLYLQVNAAAGIVTGPSFQLYPTATQLTSNDFTYNQTTGKILFNAQYLQNDLDLLVSFGTVANLPLPSGNSVSFVSKLNYTQWTLYYYDVKGRLKAVQSPYDVNCSPKVVSKTISQSSPVAFDCNSSNTILSADLKIGADPASAISPQTAKISINPEFKYADTLLTNNLGNLIFETSNLTKIDTTGNYLNVFNNTFVAAQSDTVSYFYQDSIIQDSINIPAKNIKDELYGKQIRYTGKYLVGIKKANNSITYFENEPINFDYTLNLNGENSSFTNNSILSELGFNVPQDSLTESSEIILKNIELKMSLKGFNGISPTSKFSPCDQQLYIDANNAEIIQLVNSNISLKYVVVTTLPPANTPPTTPQFSKKYWYNEYDHIVATETKDEGLTYFLYDLKENKLRYSQNAKQRVTGKFSYINYDKSFRVIETGEYDPTLNEPNVLGNDGPYSPPLCYFQDYYSAIAPIGGNTSSCKIMAQFDLDIYLGSQRKTQQSYLSYDIPNSPPNSPPFIYAYAKVSKAWNANSKTWYQYNERGELIKSVQDINGLGIKTFDYAYDWRGKLLTNIADQSAAEEFKHSYQYDADERVMKISALKGSTNFDINKLSYYLHGALKRNEIGNKLQGLDFIYTINGALKSVNNPFAGTSGVDPGYDGVTGGPNPLVKPDAFAFTLDYYPGDYNRAQSEVNLIIAPSNFNNENISYTGHIQSMRWKSQLPVNATNNFGNNVLMYEYNYDNLYRLKAAKFGTAIAVVPTCWGCQGSTFNYPTNDYALENITYDLNGNIQTLKRYSNATNLGNPQIMDDLNYLYNNTNNKNNQLQRVIDANITNLSLTTEIDLPSQPSANYSYNAIGELNYSVQDNYSYSYYYTGLVKEVRNKTTNLLMVSFEYNHLNLRQSKTVYDANGVATNQIIYVYSEAGALTATYKQILNVPHPTPYLQDHVLYGLGKAGIYDITAQKPFFELNDHLGNVRSVICETSGNLEITDFTDYYPHGGILPGRQSLSGIGYRYAYQGQEKDDETKLTNFELRQYDPRIGRWNNPDPHGQYASPYLAMGNNPVSSIDPDGGYDDWGPTLYETASQQNNPDVINNYQNSDRDYTHMSGSSGGGINANNSFTSNDQMIMDAQINNLRFNHHYDFTKNSQWYAATSWHNHYGAGKNGKQIFDALGTSGESGLTTYSKDELFEKWGITDDWSRGLQPMGALDPSAMKERREWKQISKDFKDLANGSEVLVYASGGVVGAILTGGVLAEVGVATWIAEVNAIAFDAQIVAHQVGTKAIERSVGYVGATFIYAGYKVGGDKFLRYAPRVLGQTDASHRAAAFIAKDLMSSFPKVYNSNTIYWSQSNGSNFMSIGVNPWTRTIFHAGPSTKPGP